MDLRSGEPLWQGIGEAAAHYPALQGELTCEVAIVGGGITGALLAHYLLAEGVATVLIDKHNPGTGSTAASTGLLQYEVDVPLAQLIGKVGEESAVRSYCLGLEAIGEIERIFGQLGDCGFSRRSSLYLASSRWHVRSLRNEFECRRRHGLDVEFLEAGELAEIASFRAPAAIRSQGDAQIDPFRFTQSLLQQACGQGLRAFGQSEVLSIVPTGDGVLLQLKTGQIRARRAVVATGYAAHPLLRQDVGTLHSTYAVASAPLASFAGWPEQCLIWESARPYVYLRSTPDGRAIIGGEDTDYHDDHERDALVDRQVEKLQQRFATMFPQVPFEPEFAWAGTFAQTKDGLPYIGTSPELANCYFALGYGGNGITFSAIAARIITDLYLGRPNSDADIFRFAR